MGKLFRDYYFKGQTHLHTLKIVPKFHFNTLTQPFPF